MLQSQKLKKYTDAVRENLSIYHFVVIKEGEPKIIETEFPIIWETKQEVMVYDQFLKDYLKLSLMTLNIWVTENQETVRLIRSVDMIRTTMCTSKDTNLLFSIFVKGKEKRDEVLEIINRIIK